MGVRAAYRRGPFRRSGGRGSHCCSAAGWRLSRLDDLPLYAGQARRVMALVARDKRLLRLPLDLPTGATTWRLVRANGAHPQGWPQR